MPVVSQAAVAALALVPWPSRVTPGAGAFALAPSTVIVADAALDGVADGFARALHPATGYAYVVRHGAAPKGSVIEFRLDASLKGALGEEGYRLDVTPTHVTVRAAAPAGAFYATQTMRQLLPAAIERSARVAKVAWTMPAVSIEDVPRFSWRGSHLDVSRHFMPVTFIKRHLDLMALHKFNRFHWHLTDDQGWRLEIRKYPKFTQVGAWRTETLVGSYQPDSTKRKYDGTPHGGYYTQDDVREIVAYAAARFITVVPEIEMPGHAQAAIAAYPELGNLSRPLGVYRLWGEGEDVLNASPATVAVMQDVLAEVLELFPSPWIHVGGDEVQKGPWQQNPAMQAQIRQLGLKDEHELQSWFIRQMDTWLTARGRRLIGWDEILEGGLAPNATVMSWRGDDGAIAAANAGHDAVLTPNHHTYFDYYQSKERGREPLAIGGFLPLDTVYTWDPIPKAIAPDKVGRILGVQAQVWTEYIPDGRAVEYMAWPRLSALAEVAWTPAAGRDLVKFRARMAVHMERLKVLDVNARPLDKPVF
ncbi:MAG: beta-N-acetylhexosaminidase [Gemmatimonadetes bacterium]|nr:beta-N-acetylhexosaminidase [Gemmatimonadota bacterium]